MNKALENYECEGQMELEDFIAPPDNYFKCDTCVYYRDVRWFRRADDPPNMSCSRTDRPKDFKPVVECEHYKPDSRRFKCCETCEFGNCFCEANCWLVDKEKQDTPNRHHREGFPAYGKDYHDLHEWDICDRYETGRNYEKVKLL